MITLDRARCDDCRECLWVCPNDVFAIALDAAGHERLEIRYPDQCYACGHCIAACKPHGLSHPDLPATQFVPLPEPDVSPEALLDLIRARRSIRRYRPDPPPAEIVDRLLAAGTEAGTAANAQTEGFVLVKDRTFLHELERIVVEALWEGGLKHVGESGLMARITAARLGREVFEQARRTRDVLGRRRERGEVAGSIFRDAPLLVVAHGLRANPLAPANCALALRNIELVALTLGLGTCWMGYLVAAAGRSGAVARLLDLPVNRQAYGAVTVGYPAERYTVAMPRRPREVRWAGFKAAGE
jgi:nitroreductase/NAD-dependent dihydropyrimidine dehydrogenase PreA subunit